MRYQIRAFRYSDSSWSEGYKDTYEEAVQEIDRLAKIEEAKLNGPFGWLRGDAISYTFIPVGG